MSPNQKTLLVACVVGVLGSSVAYFLAHQQDRVHLLYGDRPQPITADQLAEQGYDENLWIELTNIEFGPRAVVEEKAGSTRVIWVPVFPAGMAAEPGPIEFVLRSSRSRSEEEFTIRLRDRTSIRGAVVDPTHGRSHDRWRALLAKSYPNHKLAETIREIDIDYGGPPSAKWAAGFHSAAGGLALFAVICLLAWIGSFFRRRDQIMDPAFTAGIPTQL